MTDPTAQTPPPGWYDDPAGSSQLRWWDGTQWTQHLRARADAAAPVTGTSTATTPLASAAPAYASGVVPPVAPSKVAAGTPVYTGFIWAIVLLPVLSIIALGFFDIRGYMLRSIQLDGQASSSMAGMSMLFDPMYLLIMVLGWAVYAGTVVLAYFDWRALTRAGFVAPFHWAWSFLSATVYVIGRSVIVRRRAGHGLAPIWVLIGVVILGVIVAGVKVADAIAGIVATLPRY
ncbi:DUF2510 domain-containing protein [Leifsonia sp. Root112D2]|uniref:DUF2510 domain-containing protein n=1 Tax=Leifsonia sp. Root112D2 TaxID=1736426 RepID=UPI000700E74C|nr:DUF2510 domain-containing protein [Leifsonia sp. Root112D2]KQV07052.1 hypothetical protein ASC63_06885 [Leifsonia sp. Root112D2]